MSSGFVEQDAPSFYPIRVGGGCVRIFIYKSLRSEGQLSFPGEGGGSEDGSIGLFELRID